MGSCITHQQEGRKKLCERCLTADLSTHHVLARFCYPCQSARAADKGGKAAHAAVKSAIKRGDLPPARTLKCVDCGAQARDYDHRDYSKPLQVDPVCRSCNHKRGPARPVLTFELPDADVAHLVPATHPRTKVLSF